jgi:hypothetical protein
LGKFDLWILQLFNQVREPAKKSPGAAVNQLEPERPLPVETRQQGAIEFLVLLFSGVDSQSEKSVWPIHEEMGI